MRATLAGLLALALQPGASPAISLCPSTGIIEVTGVAPAELAVLAGLEDFDEWVRVFSVEVNDSTGVPVLGRYDVEGGVLRFHPMFPLDPGRQYRIRLTLSEPPIETVVSLPAVDRDPTTKVSEIYPTADLLPENQLKLYIHFSAPMSAGDGLPHVRLLDESGREVQEPFLPLGSEFWDRERRRYTVFFDPGRVKRGILPHEQMGRPLEAGRRYAIEIDPGWRDGRGVPLAAAFRKEFVAAPADETPIDPADWKLSVPRPGTREPLVIDFPEPLDRGLLARALAVEGVTGEAEISNREMRWSFTPHEPWAPGRYEIASLSILEDLAGNRMGRRFEVDRFDRVDEKPEKEVHRLPFVIPSPGEEPSSPDPIVVLNLYYPKPGQEKEVLETRLRASAVRARLVLPAGRVLRRTSGSDELPYVIWECAYSDQAAHDRDMEARANSPEFEAVRERMGSLLARFERSVWEVRESGEPLQGDGGITVLNWYFAKEGREEEVLSHRLHASEVRRALGHPGGRALKRVSQGDLPEVIWQLDYRDLEARERDAGAVSSTPEFREVMDHMGTLLRKFERGVWEVVELPR